MKKGIDISKWQGWVNFNEVKKDGIEFAIIRCGYARRTDGFFFRNASELAKYSIELKGIYNFSYALTVEDAVKEAQFAVKMAKKVEMPNTDVIFFDFEYDTVRYAKYKGVTLGKAECIAHTEAFCEEVERLGYKTGVYFNLDYYRNMYTPELVNKYVKWLADWTGAPNLESEYHQYSANGRVAGIDGPVDMNYYYGEEIEVPETTKTIELTLVQEIIEGKWRNGEERIHMLSEAGYDHVILQNMVNDYFGTAQEAIEGKWGNGKERVTRLTTAGYDYDLVQHIVNDLVL